MKINIIGGGPAGLYFAILMKRRGLADEVNIFERNPRGSTFGWGVVFSDKTLSYLQDADAESHARITQEFERWDNVDVVHRAEKITIRGNRFSGIARIRLLNILQERAAQLGVSLSFDHAVEDIEKLRRDCDLLVGADGVNSTVRAQYEAHFEPDLSVRPNRYIWYGTRHLFHGLTLTFRENADGLFIAHSYKFDREMSTFIVECDERTWADAGFENKTEDETRRYLAKVFAADLDGQTLASNNSRWINFLLVRNENWHYENVALLGDALHTAHFSIGSGTKLALEDAIALADCFSDVSNVKDALAEFEMRRKPVIETYQAAAYESLVWFEEARNYLDLEPLQFAYRLMTRSGKVNYENLRRRDQNFADLYERRYGVPVA